MTDQPEADLLRYMGGMAQWVSEHPFEGCFREVAENAFGWLWASGVNVDVDAAVAFAGGVMFAQTFLGSDEPSDQGESEETQLILAEFFRLVLTEEFVPRHYKPPGTDR